MGRPFRETGKAIKKITTNFELYLSTPRAGSFAVTFRVGMPQKQPLLRSIEPEPHTEPAEVIDDVIDCLESFNANDEDRLKELIPDETYRRNFLGLAKRLALDGEQVRVVGLTVLRQGEERRVALVKKQPDLPARRTADNRSSEIA